MLQKWEEKLLEEVNKIVQHGFGELNVKAVEKRDSKVQIVIQCGKSFTFFIKRELKFNKDNLI